MSKQEGITLLEMLIVLSILGLLTAVAMPTYAAWRENAHYKEAARSIASALREARIMAISRNLECRVDFDVDEGRYRVMQGDMAYGSTTFTTVRRGWVEVSEVVILKGNDTCDSSADLSIQFNPNGTGNSRYICVMDNSASPVLKYKVAVKSSTTGRVVIE